MAQIRLGRYEAEEGELPALCIRCGAPATLFKAKRFAWHPQWVYFLLLAAALPFFPAVVLLTKRMRVLLPLCAAHKNHWLRRELIFLGGLLGLCVLLLAGVAFFAERGDIGGGLPGVLFVGWLSALAAWIGALVLAQFNAVRPTEITDYSITFTGVAPEFVKQFRAEKVAAPAGPRRSNDRHQVL